MPSIHSSLRLVQANTSPDQSSSILNLPLLMKSELVLTDNSSTLNSSSPERKTLLITSLEVTTPLARKSSISASTESENSLITALVSKDSWCSTQLVVVLVQVLVLYFLKDSQSITARNPSLASPFILLLRFPLQSLNHTTQFSQPTLFSSTLMSLSCSTTKPSTISAEEISISRDPPTLT